MFTFIHSCISLGEPQRWDCGIILNPLLAKCQRAGFLNMINGLYTVPFRMCQALLVGSSCFRRDGKSDMAS